MSLSGYAQLTTVSIEKSPSYKFLLYTPAEYKEDADIKWPLIIYLHGRSACGNNFTKVRRYGLPYFLDKGMKLNAIVAAPQCPVGKNWVSDNWFIPFLNYIKDKCNIDSSRIYITGMSLGGYGAFSLAIKYPWIFAAVAPLCGGGQPEYACDMRDIPTWVFHGDKDQLVPIQRSQEMVNALRKCGGDPKFSILKGQPHDIHKTYNNQELYTWMLQQSKNYNIAEKPKKIQNPEIPLVSEFQKVPKSSNKKKKKITNYEENEKIKVEFQ